MMRSTLVMVAALLLASGLSATSPGAGAQAPPARSGAALYAETCADCHGADGRGVSGPNLTRLWASGRTDDQVFQIIRQGVTGSIMPPSGAPDADVRAIVGFLKSLGVAAPAADGAGNAALGEEIFSATCASCHRIGQRGGRLGPDLSRIAEAQSGPELRRAIREPSASIAAPYRAVTLVTRDGDEVRGARKGEDAFSIQVLDTRERLQGYLKADLKSLVHEERSLMPEFGPDRLSDRDLDDLLQFLGTLRGAPRARP